MKTGWFSRKLAAGRAIPRVLQRKYPPNPDLPTYYAIGDVHGRLDLLTALHHAMDQDRQGPCPVGGHAIEVYLGDLVDRGPGSAGVIAELIKRSAARHCIFIRGNHEVEFMRVLDGNATPTQIVNWLRFGGTATAMSYGVMDLPRFDDENVLPFVAEMQERVPSSHRQFLAGSTLFHEALPYVFVHAGVRPGVALELQSGLDLLTIREEFLESKTDHGHIVVHGHTPVLEVQLLPNRINVDTGAFATNRLSCVRLDGTGTASVLTS